MSILVTQDGICIIVEGEIIVRERTREQAERELQRRRQAKRRAA